MEQPEGPWRDRMRESLAHYFSKRSYPRQTLALLILITGLVGFLASVAMLRARLSTMAIQYPVAVLVAWCALLALIRVWVELEKRRFDPEAVELRESLESDGRGKPASTLPRDEHHWLDWLDVPDFGSMLDADDGCLPVVLVVGVLGLVAVLVMALLGAPTLLAEVFLDVFIATVLYRRLKKAAKGSESAVAANAVPAQSKALVGMRELGAFWSAALGRWPGAQVRRTTSREG